MSDDLRQSNTGTRKVLMIARSFPPFRTVGSSIRVVKFIKYLPSHGWLPVVLTIDDKTEYESQRKQGSDVLLKDIPPLVKIYRINAAEPNVKLLERGRGVSRKNKFAGFVLNILSRIRRSASKYLLIPDPFITWLPFAVKRGREIIKNEEIDIIFATCPAYSVSLIGAVLKRMTGKPLVLDFRDDWIDTPLYHFKPRPIRWIEKILEKWVVKTADRVVLVTEWSREAFIARYPDEQKNKFVFIPNGCDLEDYIDLDRVERGSQNSHFMILHTGLLVDTQQGPYRRSPKPFFQAIHRLREQYSDLADNLVVAFTGYLPEESKSMVAELDLSSSVKELGYLSTDKLIQMLKMSDLLLAINYDEWETLIPGKIYEYWAVGGPPILLLSSPGAAQSLIKQHNLGITVASNDIEAIQQAVLMVYRQRETGTPMQINNSGIEEYARKTLTTKLAQTLTEVTLS